MLSYVVVREKPTASREFGATLAGVLAQPATTKQIRTANTDFIIFSSADQCYSDYVESLRWLGPPTAESGITCSFSTLEISP
jgi:hypothetical protein